ncbi:MAG: redoxin domain-containing protein [Promethearchaeota archaeon]
MGDDAPKIKLKPVNLDKEIALNELFGKENIVLIFSRYFGCPVCQADFEKLEKIADKIQEKARLIYITQSNPENAKKFLKNHATVSFPVVCDPEKPYSIYKAFRVGKLSLGTLAKMMKYTESKEFKHGPKEGSETQSPADFVINKKGKIIHVNYSILNEDLLLKSIDSLETN